MELYSELGDNIALQYGGSEAHKKVSGGGGGGGKQVRRASMYREHAFPATAIPGVKVKLFLFQLIPFVGKLCAPRNVVPLRGVCSGHRAKAASSLRSTGCRTRMVSRGSHWRDGSLACAAVCFWLLRGFAAAYSASTQCLAAKLRSKATTLHLV